MISLAVPLTLRSPFATLPLVASSALLLGACTSVRSAQPNESVPAPRVAAHQHLISPAFTKVIDQPELDGAALLRMLDAAGIERGVALSMGYARHAAIVVHLRSRTGTPYGREDAQLFLDRLLPRAPDVVVQIAHLAGTAGFPDYAEQAMDVFASAIERKDPRTRNLYFDQTAVATSESTPEEGARTARMIRRVGPERVFFGSDMPVGGNPLPAESWAIFRAKVPLTSAEFRTIALNEPPYAPHR